MKIIRTIQCGRHGCETSEQLLGDNQQPPYKWVILHKAHDRADAYCSFMCAYKMLTSWIKHEEERLRSEERHRAQKLEMLQAELAEIKT